MWVTRREMIESLTLACNSFLEILHLSQLLKAGENSGGEVIEGCGASWMPGRVKSECVIIVRNCFLEILHLSQLLKAGGHSVGEVIEG
jgi:hypothetical protein